MTRTMRVRDARPEDLAACQKIAAQNGLTNYQWPWGGAWGALALLDDECVAFCAGRDVNNGIVIEDLWQVPGSDGVRGLAKLSEWIEETTATLARHLGHPVNLGGVVFPSNVRHRAALIARGYEPYAEVLRKVVQP